MSQLTHTYNKGNIRYEVEFELDGDITGGDYVNSVSIDSVYNSHSRRWEHIDRTNQIAVTMANVLAAFEEDRLNEDECYFTEVRKGAMDTKDSESGSDAYDRQHERHSDNIFEMLGMMDPTKALADLTVYPRSDWRRAGGVR